MTLVGLLPMAGTGQRLGMPFPKPLAPIITDSGVVPIYHHVLRRIEAVADRVYAVTSPDADPCLYRSLYDAHVEALVKPTPGEICSSFAFGAEQIIERHGRDTMIAVGLPDSIWFADQGSMRDVVDSARDDGALALFHSGADELDTVEIGAHGVLSVTTKVAQATGSIVGWGAFVIRAAALALFTDAVKDGPQLGALDMGYSIIGTYHDLGTPERYIRYHDMRSDR